MGDGKKVLDGSNPSFPDPECAMPFLTTTPTCWFLRELRVNHNVNCSEPRTDTCFLDKLIGELFGSFCQSPAFVLASASEGFMCGEEFYVTYAKLNDPFEQRLRFKEQMRQKEQGDEEAQGIYETLIDALEHGLATTGGRGLGIEY
ncbi:hypothetical protein BKA70DRAFT_707634 [Coprinopsis sp. MPI-PUGE-AT-0042]|nr:hypothetical protein BKA70DRAFT_707634 [Coprinopsis sp. MPI-PUGE-AT-0042]